MLDPKRHREPGRSQADYENERAWQEEEVARRARQFDLLVKLVRACDQDRELHMLRNLLTPRVGEDVFTDAVLASLVNP